MLPHDDDWNHGTNMGRWLPAILLVGVGAFFLLNNLGIFGWHDLWTYWPVILIVLGAVKLGDSIDGASRGGGIVLLLLGVAFLASNLGLIPLHIWQMWPLILIGLGVMMLWNQMSVPSLGVSGRRFSAGGRVADSAVFGGGKRVITDKDFRWGKFDAAFGGFEIDLRQAEMAEDSATLEMNAVFGGAEIRIPIDWNAVMKGAAVFGGYSDETVHPDPARFPVRKTLYLRGSAVFGGVVVKN
jgi:hypothetical protein